MKKILVIAPFPPPVGGVSESARKLLLVLSADNTVSVHKFNTSSGKQNEDLYASKKVSSYIFSFFTVLKLLLLPSKKKIDEVHVFATSDVAFFRDSLLILIARLFCKCIMVHLHSKKSGEFFLRNGYVDFLFFMLKAADVVFVLSEDHKKYFSTFYDGKMFVLENFCLSTEFLPSNGAQNHFLYCGRISDKKGFFDLMAAIDTLHFTRLRLDVLGVSDNQKTEKKLSEYKDFECISFHGNVFGEKKRNFFMKSGCLVFPSHFENSPVVLKEAIQAGMLIISSDLEANKNVLDDYPGAYFYPVGDFQSLARLIVMVAEMQSENFSEKKKKCLDYKRYDEEYAKNIIENARM